MVVKQFHADVDGVRVIVTVDRQTNGSFCVWEHLPGGNNIKMYVTFHFPSAVKKVHRYYKDCNLQAEF